MADLPYMRFWVGDYLGATSHLSAEEHGAYLLLLMAAWRSDGGLPSDEQRLARIARVDGQRWGAVWEAIGGFFVADGEHFRNRRLSEELTSAKADKDSAVAKAKAAAEKRWGTQKDAPSHAPSIASSNAPRMPQAMLGGMLEQCQSESESESDLKLRLLSDSPTCKPKAKTRTAMTVAQRGIWEGCPQMGRTRSSQKKLAKAWDEQECEADSMAIVRGLVDWIANGESKFFPGIHTWIADRRWENPPPPRTVTTSQGSSRPSDPYRKVL